MEKFCSNCGAKLNENAAVCVKCGVSVNPTPTTTTVNTKKPMNTLCIIGFVFSIASFGFDYLGIIVAITGVILTAIGLKQTTSNNTQGGKGLAIAGLIISILSILFAIEELPFF